MFKLLLLSLFSYSFHLLNIFSKLSFLIRLDFIENSIFSKVSFSCLIRLLFLSRIIIISFGSLSPFCSILYLLIIRLIMIRSNCLESLLRKLTFHKLDNERLVCLLLLDIDCDKIGKVVPDKADILDNSLCEFDIPASFFSPSQTSSPHIHHDHPSFIKFFDNMT